jgi:hypothetical protein
MIGHEPIGNRRAFDKLPGGGYAYTLIDDAVRVEVRHLRREYRQLHAEVDVLCDWAGASRHNSSLSRADLNLSSQTARRGLAKYCAERAHTKPDDFDWMGLVDATCIEVIAADRAGEAPIILDDAPDLEDRDFSVHGIQIPADSTSMLIAHGDTLKSLLLLLFLGTLALRGIAVLYLDWEWSADRHKRRKRRLFGFERLDTLHYLRCHAPLAVEADRIRRYCDQHQIAFVGGDSVAFACDGKLADDDTAIRFHRVCANDLPPSLWTAHVPKSTVGPDARATVGPFGSVFFSNLCRMTWQVKKQVGASDDLVTVALLPEKQNDGARVGTVGLEFDFAPDQITVRNVNIATVDGLADKLPLNVRIEHALKPGPMTLVALADELGAKADSIDKAVRRGAGTFTKVLGQDGIHRIALVSRRTA